MLNCLLLDTLELQGLNQTLADTEDNNLGIMMTRPINGKIITVTRITDVGGVYLDPIFKRPKKIKQVGCINIKNRDVAMEYAADHTEDDHIFPVIVPGLDYIGLYETV